MHVKINWETVYFLFLVRCLAAMRMCQFLVCLWNVRVGWVAARSGESDNAPLAGDKCV